MLKRILIANRGEIAVRIIKSCKKLGISAAVVYSEADRDALFVKLADEAICIGPAAASESYLNIPKIIKAAKDLAADAIHPGYGFLSENAKFATACAEAGIIFIGPRPDTIHMLGNKGAVKEMLQADPAARAAGVPLIPGYNSSDQSLETFQKAGAEIGYPVLLKAAAGGGGKGMRVVNAPEEMPDALTSVKREALASFGSEEVLAEKYFTSCRHVEIQIFGDTHGEVVDFGERDCSVQRRYQKVFEESPSPFAGIDKLRESIASAARWVAKKANYVGAGTVEFLLDATTSKFYFLEVNTRLQVEHPITEMVRGLDLVELQIKVAMGKKLRDLIPEYFQSPKPQAKGHAIECRLYAEDPTKGFLPSVGPVLLWTPAKQDGLRFEEGVYSGSEISVHYDPMIAKVAAWGATREIAISRLRQALSQTALAGLVANKPFLIDVLGDSLFASGQYDTSFIGKQFPTEKLNPPLQDATLLELAAVSTLWNWHNRQVARQTNHRAIINRRVPSGWSNGAPRVQHSEFSHKKSGTLAQVTYLAVAPKGRGLGQRVGITTDTKEFIMKLEKHVKPSEDKGAKAKEKGKKDKEIEDTGLRSVEGGVSVSLCSVTPLERGATRFQIELNAVRRQYTICPGEDHESFEHWIHASHLGDHCMITLPRHKSMDDEEGAAAGGDVAVRSPMPCTIVSIAVKSDDVVKKGQLLLIIESMKMEMKVYAPQGGIVSAISVRPTQSVKEGTPLLTIKQQQS